MRKYSEWHNAIKVTKGTNTNDLTEIPEDFRNTILIELSRLCCFADFSRTHLNS